MPLIGIPDSITPELLYGLAKMGHGDTLVIADANFPSDSVAKGLIINTPIRVHGTTADVLKDILRLIPLDQYCANPVEVMDRVDSDKAKNLFVPAYNLIAEASGIATDGLLYVERFQFYERAKKAFLVIQTDDRTLYANCIISKGVV